MSISNLYRPKYDIDANIEPSIFGNITLRLRVGNSSTISDYVELDNQLIDSDSEHMCLRSLICPNNQCQCPCTRCLNHRLKVMQSENSELRQKIIELEQLPIIQAKNAHRRTLRKVHEELLATYYSWDNKHLWDWDVEWTSGTDSWVMPVSRNIASASANCSNNILPTITWNITAGTLGDTVYDFTE